MTVPGQSVHELPPSGGEITNEEQLAAAMTQFAAELSPGFVAGDRLETSLVYPWTDKNRISYELRFTAIHVHDDMRQGNRYLGPMYFMQLSTYYVGGHSSITPELRERIKLEPEDERPDLSKLEDVQVSYSFGARIGPTGAFTWEENRRYDVCTTVDTGATVEGEMLVSNELNEYAIVLGKRNYDFDSAEEDESEQAADLKDDDVFAQLIGSIGLELAESDSEEYVAKAAWLFDCLKAGDSAQIDPAKLFPPEVMQEIRMTSEL